jgi:hypothetical protein
VVHGKYLDEMFSLAFMSWNGLSLRKQYHQEVLFNLVEKTKQKYLLSKSTKGNISTSFDLWMFQGAHVIFTLWIKKISGWLVVKTHHY